jgi:hypothetical protein
MSQPPDRPIFTWQPKLDEIGYNIYWSLNPKVELRISPIQGGGLFAKEKIFAGEVIWDDIRYTNAKWDMLDGDPLVVTEEELKTWPKERQDFFTIYAYMVGPNIFYGPRTREDFEADASAVMNHCCDPNTWFVGDTKIEARRDIEPGEELTYDYATTETIDVGFQCDCGHAQCRRDLKGTDYQLPELQERYGVEHFVGYIQKLILAEREQAKKALPTTNIALQGRVGSEAASA